MDIFIDESGTHKSVDHSTFALIYVEVASVEKKIHKISIDGQKPKWYSQRLKKVLRDKGISVKKIVTVRREESCPGLRVTDCLAGLTRYYYDNPESMAAELFHKFEKVKKVSVELISP